MSGHVRGYSRGLALEERSCSGVYHVMLRFGSEESFISPDAGLVDRGLGRLTCSSQRTGIGTLEQG
jgi:hypothetical protein